MPIVLQKFEITMNDGEGNFVFEEVDGSFLKNDYELELFVHRTPKGNFRVSEATTGLAITSEMKTKKEAVEELHKVIDSRGLKVVKEKIKERLEEVNELKKAN
jgi:hypothetical protein